METRERAMKGSPLLVPQDQVDSSRFGVVADREVFAVVYPAGVFAAGNLRNAWNLDREPGVKESGDRRHVAALLYSCRTTTPVCATILPSRTTNVSEPVRAPIVQTT